MENSLLSQKISRIQHFFPLRSRRECEEVLDLVNGDEEQAVNFLEDLGPRIPSNQEKISTTTDQHKACSTCRNNHVSIRIKPSDSHTDPSDRDYAFTIKTAVRILLESRNMNKLRRCKRQTVGLEQTDQV